MQHVPASALLCRLMSSAGTIKVDAEATTAYICSAAHGLRSAAVKRTTAALWAQGRLHRQPPHRSLQAVALGPLRQSPAGAGAAAPPPPRPCHPLQQ